ncbi:hypothetical protein POM88_005757 [Heracleum sosnowskyi]|uniref:CCHC-type domain-containing protein n=1 Tax=Heracleum sosnowskyi TaxID=360622 RepID=A0AAD8J2Y8_9APIA|nr:hypothetical protein POM88_005757 [Heracleum sosnowskyi]
MQRLKWIPGVKVKLVKMVLVKANLAGIHLPLEQIKKSGVGLMAVEVDLMAFVMEGVVVAVVDVAGMVEVVEPVEIPVTSVGSLGTRRGSVGRAVAAAADDISVEKLAIWLVSVVREPVRLGTWPESVLREVGAEVEVGLPATSVGRPVTWPGSALRVATKVETHVISVGKLDTLARECSQGGGGGGNPCYKCGETGHMARACNKDGGNGAETNGTSSWNHSSKCANLSQVGNPLHQNREDGSSYNLLFLPRQLTLKFTKPVEIPVTSVGRLGTRRGSVGRAVATAADDISVEKLAIWLVSVVREPVRLGTWPESVLREVGAEVEVGLPATSVGRPVTWPGSALRVATKVETHVISVGKLDTLARECSQGGGGGGNSCYKCGETGHMARACNKDGGNGAETNGTSSWNHSSKCMPRITLKQKSLYSVF